MLCNAFFYIKVGLFDCVCEDVSVSARGPLNPVHNRWKHMYVFQLLNYIHNLVLLNYNEKNCFSTLNWSTTSHVSSSGFQSWPNATNFSLYETQLMVWFIPLKQELDLIATLFSESGIQILSCLSNLNNYYHWSHWKRTSKGFV